MVALLFVARELLSRDSTASAVAGKQGSFRGVFAVREFYLFYLRPTRNFQFSSSIEQPHRKKPCDLVSR